MMEAGELHGPEVAVPALPGATTSLLAKSMVLWLAGTSAKAADRTIPRLLRRIGSIISSFSAQECMNFIQHAGYIRT